MAMPANRPLQIISFRDIGAFVATLIKRREEVFGKRIDLASDELTGEETVSILSEITSHEIKYESFDPEFFRAESEDMADMFNWFDEVGYDADIERLRRDYPEVKWQTFKEWAKEQDWSILD